MSMINNDYILELDINFDILLLTKLALSAPCHSELKTHQRFTKDYPYLENIRNQYPILGQVWNVYHFLPFTGIKTHIDAKRLCTLNIPLQGTKSSITKFYKPKDDMEKTYFESGVLNYIKTPLETEFEFSLIRPTLIRTDVPHSVLAGSEKRLVISWGISELDFFQSKKFFKSMSML